MFRILVALLCAAGLTVSVARAEHGAPPASQVLLTVSGAIAHPHDMVFDRDMLRALDWQEIETFTKWTEGPQQFSGPSLSALLAAVGARGGRLRAVALNDYAVEIPIEDAALHNVILAMEHGGAEMGVRQKGPVWVIYPQLSQALAEESPFSHKMIWQMTRLTILD